MCVTSGAPYSIPDTPPETSGITPAGDSRNKRHVRYSGGTLQLRVISKLRIIVFPG